MSLVSRLFLPKGGVKANGQLWVRTFKVGLVPRPLAHLRFIKSTYCSKCIAQGRGGWGKKMLRNSSEYSAVNRLMDKQPRFAKAFSNDWVRQLFGSSFNLG